MKKERSRERAELAKAWNLLDPLGRGELKLGDCFKPERHMLFFLYALKESAIGFENFL